MTTATLRLGFLFFVSVLIGIPVAHAQRQVEALGRGVVAMRTSSTQVYVGWRLLGDDSADIGFNLYRSIAGATATKLNGATPITASTNYLDTPAPAAFASTISYYVVPVLNGVEQTASAAYTLPANTSAAQQFTTIPFATAYPNPLSTAPYTVKFCWVGDFDGDGEYDFLVDRLSTSANAERQYLEAYKRDGTFLWRMDMGINSVNQYAYEPGSSAISVGDTDNVTVFDLDGDGRAEVAVRTANGVTVTNAAGQIVATITDASNTTQFVSIIDGLAGTELARTTLPNPWAQHGTLTSKCAIGYFDGLRPSVLFYGYNRATSGEFYRVFSAFDFRNGQLTLRWSTPQNFAGAEGHQIRIADVDNDGKDEVIDIGHVIDDNGSQLFLSTEVTHGDRFHVADINPDRPGLENYIIQQNNPSFLATAYFDAGTGQMIKKWYATDVVDVGRGIALDLNSTHKGYEMYSTQPGIFNAKGTQIYTNSVWAPEGLWWDADLLREFIDGAGNGALNPAINKFNQSTGNSDRVWSVYNDFGAYSITQAYGGRPAFWGDILGDWREELVFVKTDYTGLRIYSTVNVATNRLYTLMHNPAYRCQATTKGYVQSSNVDYYLGIGMTTPPPPPMVPATLAWAGGSGNSTWNVGTTAAWKSTSTAAATTFANGNSVRFDIAGSATTPVVLSGPLQPADVTFYSPNDYTLDGTSGSLTGTMKLVKAGKGSLRVTGSHPFTGTTTVWDGALRIDGALTGSPVTVWGGTWGGALAKGLTGGRLSGNGSISQPVSLQYRGALTPGAGMNSPGTLTLGAGLSAADGSVLAFDLSNDPTGLINANDRLAITGNLSLSGSVALLINPTSGLLAPGTYTLATYTGALTGSAANLSVVVPEGTAYTLALGSGALSLTIPVTRAPAAATWTGAVSSLWDIATSANWSLTGTPGGFVSGDTATFDNTGSARPSVTLNTTAPVGGLSFSGSTNYTVSGTGSISGNGTLSKSGNGTVTLNTTNTFTGGVSITGGVLAVDNLNDGGLPSSIGASSSAAANFVINGGTLRLSGLQTNTNRAMTLGANGATLDIPAASVTLQISGGITGSGSLTKTGAGALVIATANTYSGGTTLQTGTLVLASDTANASGLGTGGITLQGGTLRMYDNVNTPSAYTSSWPVNVPAGASARLEADGRCNFASALTGSGTLDFNTSYVRTDITGNWSAFAGTLNISTDADGGDLRLMQSAGLPSALLNVAALTYTVYNNTLGSNFTYPLGGLSGSGTLGGSITTGRTVTWQIGGRNIDTTFAGIIRDAAGPAALTKSGLGNLTLTGPSTYTGATTVSAGSLVLASGSLAGSTVTVNSGARFGGKGAVTGNVTFNSGSTILAAPASGPLAITGNLACNGSVTVAAAPGATLGTGTYPIITYTGTLTGSPVFAWSGAGFTATFSTATAGVVNMTLAVETSRPSGNVTWSGSAGATWDTTSVNWLFNGGNTAFKDGDNARFDNSSTVTAITLSGALAPASVTVDSSQNYTFSGNGSLSGNATLLKSGNGTLTLNSAHSFTGGATLSSGTVAVGLATSLGSGNITLSGGTLATGSLTIANPVIVTADSKITGGNAGGTHGIGVVSGSGNLTLDATNVFDMEGSLANFSGRVIMTGTGSFRFFGGAGSSLADFELGTRNLNARSGSAFALGSLSGDAGSSLNNNSSNTSSLATFTVGANGRDTTFAGVISNGGSRLAALTKTGNGTLILSGNNSHTGATAVSTGTLLLTGALGNTTVSVSANATFGGNGTLSGNLTLASGSRLALGFGSSPPKGPTVSGVSTLNGAITVVPALLGGALSSGTYNLLAYSGSLAGSPVFTWSDTTGSGSVATFNTATAGLVRITLTLPPVPPSGLAATSGNAQVALAWSPVSDAASYTVLRSTATGSGFSVIASGLVSSNYTDSTALNDATYFYVVRAVNAAGTSTDSAEVSATPVSPLSPVQSWRMTYFSTSTATGDAANNADPDGDGLPNLLEYALGSLPDAASSAATPVLEVSGVSPLPSFLQLSFQRIADPALTYTVQGSSDLATWIDVWSSTGSANANDTVSVDDTFDLATNSRRFLRLKVSLSPE